MWSLFISKILSHSCIYCYIFFCQCLEQKDRQTDPILQMVDLKRKVYNGERKNKNCVFLGKQKSDHEFEQALHRGPKRWHMRIFLCIFVTFPLPFSRSRRPPNVGIWENLKTVNHICNNFWALSQFSRINAILQNSCIEPITSYNGVRKKIWK